MDPGRLTGVGREYVRRTPGGTLKLSSGLLLLMLGHLIALTGLVAAVAGVAVATLGPHAVRATALVAVGVTLQGVAQLT